MTSYKERDRLTVEERAKLNIEGDYLRCPDCEGLLCDGPAGGMSINYYCHGCGAGFNISFWHGALVFAERITDRKVDHG